MQKTVFLLLTFLLFANHSIADEIRMAYMQLNENKKNNFSILFKIPTKKGRKLSINAQLPDTCKNISQIDTHLVNKAYLNSWDIECKDGLVGKKISIDGLKQTKTDLLLQIKFLNRESQTILLSADNTSHEIPKEESYLDVIATYTSLGIVHILEGFDHLLFVLALLLIVKSVRQLIWTITAFTLAHSITLAGASLGYISLPQQPVEAIIALSIVFLAMEVIHQKRGINGIASRFPWIVAFTFGLLHGFGFAGALSEIGLPQQSVPLALLFFNVGVEIGQLIFVSIVLLFGYVFKKLKQSHLLQRTELVVTYLIGGLSSFWLIERVSAF